MGQFDHGSSAIHSSTLQTPESFRFGPAVALHQHSLGSFDNLAVLQSLAKRGILFAQVAEFSELCARDQDCRPDLVRLDRFHQVGQNVLFQSSMNKLLVSVGGNRHGRDHFFLVDLA